ncbi:MAG: hypothetical protein PHE43_01785 [Candidatus Nanoarchaeia archaeon]|nr:hypothetical protein [Candidatus Nanoarchaeia archaeon]
MVKYKQRCGLCKKNMVIMTYGKRFPICVQCEMKQINDDIEDPKFKKMFDIDKKFYEENSFLRDIKKKYLAYGVLSEKQIEAFKKTVAKLKKK